jgi:multimeric flavodoxin WrbA
MSTQKVVLLDGTRSGDEGLTSTLAILTDVLKQTGADVQVFALREVKLAHCIGCFGCWLETPGLCRYGEAGRAIVQEVIQSDTIVLFTPVVFGGYSSQLKQIVDRFASLCLPYFSSYHGEVHHRPRYAHYPRWVGIGVQNNPNAKEAGLFKLVVGRNAINFHAPSYAAEVVTNTDNPDKLPGIFQALLSRKDSFPWGDAVKSLMPAPDMLASRPEPDGTRRACLIIDSPKTLSTSTSSVLGNYLLERLKMQGWETESLILKSSLLKQEGQAALLAAIDRADLLLFAFPLYIDALPFLMTKGLEVIAAHRQVSDHSRPQRLFAIANNGFAESYQNNLALSIIQRFATECEMTFVGSLAMGAGEAMSGGQPLKPIMANGVPCAHVMAALDAAGDALAWNRAVPPEAIRGIAKSPIPYTPFAVWRWMFEREAAKMWEKRAAEHGVSKQAMLAAPYASGAAKARTALATTS